MIDSWNRVTPCELYKLIISTTESDIEQSLKIMSFCGKSTKYAYVSLFDDVLLQSNDCMIESFYMRDALQNSCDIYDIRELENQTYKHEFILLDYIASLDHTKINLEQINRKWSGQKGSNPFKLIF
jgi:hypothetical protein